MALGYGPSKPDTAKLYDFDSGKLAKAGKRTSVESEGSPMSPWSVQKTLMDAGVKELTAAEYLQNAGLYNVMDYGATGDGATDDTAAIQEAIDAASDAGGGTVWFPPGVYLALALQGKSNVNLLGEAGAILRKNGGAAGTHVLELISTNDGSAVAGTSTDAVGDTVLDFPGTGNFAAGDYAMLYDDTFAYTTFGRNEEIVRVNAVAAATVTTRDAINRTYLLASNPMLQKLSMVRNVTIKGLRFEIPVGTDGGIIYCERAAEIRIVGNQFTGADDDAAVYLYESAWCWVNDNLFEDMQNVATGGFGYAVSIVESSHNILVSDNICRNIREMNASNGAMLIAFIGNYVHTAEASGINTHGTGCKHVLIANNEVINAGNGGIQVGHSSCEDHDEDVQIIGNKISLSRSQGIGVDCFTDVNLNIMVAGNFIYQSATQLANKSGILLQNSDGVAVLNNVIVPVDNNNLAGILIIDCDDCAVIGNYIRSCPAGSGVRYQGTNGNLRIAMNTFHEIGSFDVNDQSGGSTTTAHCEFNWADGINVSIGAGTRRRFNNFDNMFGVTGNKGDNNVTLVIGSDASTVRFASTLTANRTVTLPATAYDGARFRIVRTGLGAFTLDVGGLKTIPAATAAFVDVEWDGVGSAWRLTGYGLL
jgi:Endopolygalacturonase